MKILKRALLTYFLTALSVVNVGATEERTFTMINSSNGLTDNSGQALACTITGRMVISSLGNLNFYDGNSFSHADIHQDCLYQLPAYWGSYRLHFDHNHHLWQKDTHTLSCMDLMQEKFVQNVDSVIAELECPLPMLDFFADGGGGIWTLTETGLYSVDRRKSYNVLRDRHLQEVDTIGSRLLLFYDNGEQTTLDLETGNLLQCTKPYEWDKAQKYAATSMMLRHGQGMFVLRNGDREGILLYFHQPTGTWTTIMETPFILNHLALHNNKLYIATEQGYGTYDLSTKATEWFKELTLTNGTRVQPHCNALAFDKQGGLWIATKQRGLLYARPRPSPFRVLSGNTPQGQSYMDMMEDLEQNITEFQGLRANCMFTDSRGWSWIGTTTGLYMYKSPHTKPLIFNKSTGFYNDVVHAVVEDNNHNIWASTSNGISCVMFDADTVTFVNSFNSTDNVPDQSFYNCKAIHLPDGEIAMQGLDNVVVFNPSELNDVNSIRDYKLYPKLVKLMVNGKTVEPGPDKDEGNVIIDRAVTRVKDISVKSNQNTLSLTFSSLNYYRPLQSFYYVKVEGLRDSKWEMYSYYNSEKVDNAGMLHLPLVGLPPGEYKILLQVSMFPGRWSGKPYIWYVHVNQPWWRTTGVFILFALIALGLLIANFIVYTRNAQMRTQRNHEEEDVISKIRQFVERYDSYDHESLSPKGDDFDGSNESRQLSTEFTNIMMKLMPYVREHKTDELTMRMLADVAKVDLLKLYDTIMGNIYKSPRQLVRLSRLQRGAELLKNTDMTVERIAKECGFYTPNYFIGNFFHTYKLTPLEFREENGL